eukprot:TRINITY_DN25836_c0_g1_i1.p1 TRINITY_DN25836_c0_g1~~TRINITY_DN25836_c0_g1_i1.p1  ORF type:complete len:125 (-),score=20.54 TRINITY_DN25836_c0_g1_i1:400-735(-)
MSAEQSTSDAAALQERLSLLRKHARTLEAQQARLREAEAALIGHAAEEREKCVRRGAGEPITDGHAWVCCGPFFMRLPTPTAVSFVQDDNRTLNGQVKVIRQHIAAAKAQQ